MKYDFQDYEAIPNALSAYVMGVADAEYITDIPLDDINNFLNGLEDWMDDPALTYNLHMKEY